METEYDDDEPRRHHLNGSAKIVMWILGIFGAVMTVLLTLTLQAVYQTNGDVREVMGRLGSLEKTVETIVGRK